MKLTVTKITKLLKDKDGNVLEIEPDGSINTYVRGATDGTKIGNIEDRLLTHDRYNKKNSQLNELNNNGVDLNNINLLRNSRGITITLNDGSLIYTE